MSMKNIWVFAVLLLCILVVAGCSKDSLPYKSLSDTRLSSPTGKVVAVQTAPAPVVEEKPEETITTTNEPVIETSPITGVASCHDTDYGMTTSAAGKVKGMLDDGSEFEETDACVGDVLYEYYCDGSTALFAKEVCDRGCKNGFCV